MADESIASIIPLHQPKKAKTGAERARAYRQRKRQKGLGSSDVAGWLFLAIGVGADLVALVMPSCAARLWQARQRRTLD